MQTERHRNEAELMQTERGRKEAELVQTERGRISVQTRPHSLLLEMEATLFGLNNKITFTHFRG
jgi:hypothetical protein